MPGPFNVIMTSGFLAAPAVEILERANCVIHYMRPYPSAEDVAALTAQIQADAILTRQGPVSVAAMDASKNLRVIARHGVGVDDVDIAAASSRGILVTRAPGSNTRAVAEHTLALILALSKDLRHHGDAIAAGRWRHPTASVRDLEGLRVGLLGFGEIAQAVAPMARAFGMVVSAYSPSGRAGTGDVTLVPTLGDLLAGSDVLSVHCPLTPATHHLIDGAALARLPQGAFVINTARGGIIDETALAAALQSGHIGGAGLDVFEGEPPSADHPLRNHPKVLATPHISGVTQASLVNMGVMAAECIAWALTGQVVPEARIVKSVPEQRIVKG
jgi:D-3-phosphoglycerate dehydrogenase